MDEIARKSKYLKGLILKFFPDSEEANAAFLENALNDEKFLDLSEKIVLNQQELIKNIKMRWRIEQIKDKHIVFPNGMVDKPYKYYFDMEHLDLDDIVYCEMEGLEKIGLSYSSRTQVLEGLPTEAGDTEIIFKFRVDGEDENNDLNEKRIRVIINPNPKSLWKDLPSDKNGPFWKVDNQAVSADLGDKKLVVASKRGRSHANVGSYRDDDFAAEHLEESGWNIVAVADGAGSAKYSREGSRLACEGIVNYFKEHLTGELVTEVETILQNGHSEKEANMEQKLSTFVQTHLGKAAFQVHKNLKNFAKAHDFELKDLNTTLIFSLFKKMDFGYVIFSFGVGDCPIILLNKELTNVTLLNKMDVGEYGGGTRFITMPEIFQSADFYQNRFSFKIVSDFSYLMLMTDGIYDPKFEVEANLEKIDKWKAFLADLEGENKDGAKVDFDKNNEDIANQLSKWLDFWSVGNHDDRTLAMIF